MIVPGAIGILRTHFTNFLTLGSLCVTAWPLSCLSRSAMSFPTLSALPTLTRLPLSPVDTAFQFPYSNTTSQLTFAREWVPAGACRVSKSPPT